jgi:hypothetical protein
VLLLPGLAEPVPTMREGSGPFGEEVGLAVLAPLWMGLTALTPLGMGLAALTPLGMELVVLTPRGASSWPLKASSEPRTLGLAVSEPLEKVGLGPLAVFALLEGLGFEPLAVIPQLWQVCFAPLTFVLLTDGPQSVTARPLCSSC